MAQAANSDEAKRCISEAELLLMGAPNWREEKKKEMITKAVRLLRKSNQMNSAIMPSIPQWLSMSHRLPVDVIRDAQRTYARITTTSTSTNGSGSGATTTTTTDGSGSSSSTSRSNTSHSDLEVHSEVTSFLQKAWRKLEYVVYDVTGLGRFFSPEWKSTILMIYMLLLFLIVVRLFYGAPIISMLYIRKRYSGDGGTCGGHHSTPLMGDRTVGVVPPYRTGHQQHVDDGVGENGIGLVRVYFPLLSWIVFFFIPTVLQQFQ